MLVTIRCDVFEQKGSTICSAGLRLFYVGYSSSTSTNTNHRQFCRHYTNENDTQIINKKTFHTILFFRGPAEKALLPLTAHRWLSTSK